MKTSASMEDSLKKVTIATETTRNHQPISKENHIAIEQVVFSKKRDFYGQAEATRQGLRSYRDGSECTRMNWDRGWLSNWLRSSNDPYRKDPLCAWMDRDWSEFPWWGGLSNSSNCSGPISCRVDPYVGWMDQERGGLSKWTSKQQISHLYRHKVHSSPQIMSSCTNLLLLAAEV